MDGLNKSLFLGRHRHERLTSNQIGRSVDKKLCLKAQTGHLFRLGPQWAGPILLACQNTLIHFHIGCLRSLLKAKNKMAKKKKSRHRWREDDKGALD